MADEGSDEGWDKNRVYDQYEKHAGHRLPNIDLSLSSFKLSNPLPSRDELSSGSRKKYAALAGLVLVIAAGFYFNLYSGLIYSDEQIAQNVASSNPLVQQFNQQFDTSVSASEIPESTLQELKASNQVPESASNVYVVDYTTDDGQGVSAYVAVSSRNVVDVKRSFTIS